MYLKQLKRLSILLFSLSFLSGCVTAPIFMVNTDNLEALKKVDPAKVDEILMSNPTALWQAAATGRMEFVRVLIDKGANINVKHNGVPAIVIATHNRHFDVVKLLVEKGADIDASNGFGSTSLHFAVAKGLTLGDISWLLDSGANIDKVENQSGNTSTPLTIAITTNRSEIAKELVSRGASIEIPSSFSPILRAAQYGELELVKYLLSKGADLNDIGADENINGLSIAVANQKWNVAQYLLDQGINTDQQGRGGFKAIHYAVNVSAPSKLFSNIIQNTASIDSKLSETLDTPLILATYHNNSTLAKLLIDAGADINVKNTRGDTPLHWATHHGNVEISRLLAQKGASLYAVNSNNLSPYAIAQNKPNLLAAITNIDVQAKVDTPPKKSPKASAKPLLASTGSGFFINKHGDMVTNHHVIDKCEFVKVRHNNELYGASVVVFDNKNDLAVVSAELDNNAFSNLSAQQYPSLGESVTVLGYPLNSILGNSLKLTTGILSSHTGIQGDSSVYQISAPIQSGNSGGPVYDEAGEVLGVAVSTLDPLVMAKHTGSLPQNVNYAVKSTVLTNFLKANNIRFSVGSGESKQSPKQINKANAKAVASILCYSRS
ncbi:ankyrin repeat domain-containing protein [Thalassotalea aquiviva]|uniref:ankyrin repeat domain-containing protein n=1 Tax=Thalassotalea aquiviva TaxID=3242415 RepID=UPI00352A1D8B